MAVLLEGMNAHADADAFPIWVDEGDPLPELLYTLLPYLRDLQDTWLLTCPLESLETLVKLMESIDWKRPDQVHIADDTATRKWTPAQFHKAVTVDKEFK